MTVDVLALKDAKNVAYATPPVLGPNSWFNIQVKPMLGSYMTVQRTLPAGLDPVMDMH